MRTRWHSPAAERSVKFFSELGENGMLWIAFALGGAAGDSDRRRWWLRAAAVPPLTLLINFAAKTTFRRRRPKIKGQPALGDSVTNLSFPSAHASMSFAAAASIGELLPSQRKLLFAVAALMAASRPYLGMHYPSDVVAGAMLGTVVGRSVFQKKLL